MKHFIKSNPPQCYEKYVSKRLGETWDRFVCDQHECHEALLQSMKAEQDNRCCYCERTLQNRQAHVEHFAPKSIYPQLTFDYQNLMASCSDSLTCGHAKQGRVISEDLSPLQLNCEHRFTFTLHGMVVPSNATDKLTQSAIQILNLNHPKLVDSRKEIARLIYLNKESDCQIFGPDTCLSRCNELFNGYYRFVRYIMESIKWD